MNSLLRKIVIALVVLLVLATASWFGRKAYKKASERRLIAQARQQLEKKEWRNCALNLQRALQINPLSFEAGSLMADLLETTGSPAALNWRIRNAQVLPTSAAARFGWAQTALRMKDLRSAANALSGADENSKETATYHKLAGALAWSEMNGPEAEKHYKQAQRLEPTNQVIRLNLATIQISSTDPAVVRAARAALESLSADLALRNTALHHLASDALVHTNFEKAVAFSTAIVTTPTASFDEKLAHLALLKQTQHSQFTPYLASLKTEATNSGKAFALGHWMAMIEGPTNALRWLNSLPSQIQTNQPVPLIISDCQISVKNWSSLLALIEKQDWGDLEFYRLSLATLAQRSLGHTTRAETSWRKALRLSNRRLDRLSRLLTATREWGWKAEATALLQEIVNTFPKETWAVEQLVAAFYQAGNTAALEQLLTKVQAANPTDTRLKNNLANVHLLRQSDLTKAHRLAKEAFESAPQNPFFICTYAYSLCLQQKQGEALKVLEQLNSNHLRIPALAAYYGAIQAQSGQKDLAREPLKIAEAAPLLPEEKEMVRLAKARL